MTSQATQHEAQPGDPREAEDQNPLEVFGSLFRQQLEHAIEPIMENIRRHNLAALINGGGAMIAKSRSASAEESESASESSQESRSDQREPSFALDQSQVEEVLQPVLDGTLDLLFSDELQQLVRKRSERSVQSLLTAGKDLASRSGAFDVKPEQFSEALDQLVQESFSDSVRKKAHHDAEQIVRSLAGRDGPAARKAGGQFLSHLTQQRLSAADTFWQHVLTTIMQAAVPGKESSAKQKKASEPDTEQDLPGTLLRSDKRAQDIWTKARDKAAEKTGPGAGAERAGYAALKQRYEKKGDRWVKKES